jgi:hypothetical protein
MPRIQTDPVPSYRQVALYGPPKSGKTRTATSLPWGSVWGERAIYCGWEGQDALLSVLPHHRERLILVEPEPKVIGGKSFFDPLEEAHTIATTDWSKQFPDCKTLIWDTMTETSYQLLKAYANTGQFSDKHIAFGKPGTSTHHVIPMEGDFGAAQNSALFILDFLKRLPMNIVVLFHDEFVQPKKDADPRTGGLFGGPALAGKAGTRAVSQRFNNLFRQSIGSKGGQAPGQTTIKPKFVVQTQPSGNEIWLMGARLPLPENPIARVELEPDPVNFWRAYDKALEDGNVSKTTEAAAQVS